MTATDERIAAQVEGRWQNRIVGYDPAYPVSQLMANPDNWRIHPDLQQQLLEGVLDEYGWVQAVTVNQQTGHMVDGHMRALLADRREEETVPAIIVDLSLEEERAILATLDPLAAMAGTDTDKLSALLSEVKDLSGDERVSMLLEEVRERWVGTELILPVQESGAHYAENPHARPTEETGEPSVYNPHKLIQVMVPALVYDELIKAIDRLGDVYGMDSTTEIIVQGVFDADAAYAGKNLSHGDGAEGGEAVGVTGL